MGSSVISIGDSISITIFSMVIVFVGLIVLALLISVLKNIGGEKTATKQAKPIAKEEIIEKIEEKPENDEELVAVIAAAVAASLGLSIPEINIKSIRRVGEEGPLWAQAGKQERIFGKL